MNKQEALRLLSKAPDGTTHIHSSGDYFKNGNIWENDQWLLLNRFSTIAMFNHTNAYTIEQLREIASVTRDEALQWCTDNVSDWDIGSNQPPQGWKWCKAVSSSSNPMILTDGKYSITEQDWLTASGLTREQALQWCNNNVLVWPINDTIGTAFPRGWRWESCGPYKYALCHSIHDPIIEQNWIDEGMSHRANVTPDPVHQPKHYEVIEGLEAIEIIASSLTRDEWKGYCIGNILKYRLRAGKKDALQQDIDKANEYEMLFDKYKELNRK